MKQIQTTRFGTVQYNEDHLITFPDGMVGFHQLKTYVLVESPQNPLILWLQSTDHAEIAFPVVEPWFFKTDYRANMSEADKITLGYEPGNTLKTMVVLTIPSETTRMTVNLRAPVVINIQKAKAAQLILQEKSYEVRAPAHEAFTKALASLQLIEGGIEQNVDEEVWAAVKVNGSQKTTVEHGAGV